MKPTAKAHIAVLCTNLFFASNYSMVKYISPSLVKPFALNILRVGVSILLFWLFWFWGKTLPRGQAVKPGIHKKDIGLFFLCALTGVGLNQTLFIKGLTLTTPIHASLLILCTPLLITIFAFWILKEKVTILKISGLILGIGGSVILILAKEHTNEGDYLSNRRFVDSVKCYFLCLLFYTGKTIDDKILSRSCYPLDIYNWLFSIATIWLETIYRNTMAAI